MSDIGWHRLTKTPRRWVQFLGWFLGIEFSFNVVLISTVSGLGWDGEIRGHRWLVQGVVLGVALAFALYQAFSRSVTGWIGARVRPLAGIVERNEHLLAKVDNLEHLLAGSQADAERTLAARYEREREQEREVEQAQRAAEAAPIQRLAQILQAIIASEQFERQAATLRRCHRNGRGEIICTLPLGRVHGVSDGVQFMLIDEQENRPIGLFRITGTAETFAACTLLEGEGWLPMADRYGDANLPPHSLQFPLPDAARGIDAQSADRLLRLLTTVATDRKTTAQRAATPMPQEVRR